MVFVRKMTEKEKLKRKAYRLKNKERDKKYKKAYRLKNKEKLKEQMRLYRLKHKERDRKYAKEYRIKNKDKIKKRMKAYRIRSRKKIAQYVRERRQKDIRFKIVVNLRHRANMALRGTVKSKKTMKLLGTSIDNFWSHLESKFKPGMTRNNYGKRWHIDHVIPCASFDLTKPEEQFKCFHYTNLQPLWAKENLKKGAKLEWLN